jgi:hypothetical protein
MSVSMEMSKSVANALKTAMSNQFLSMYGLDFNEEDFTEEAVHKYLNTDADVFVEKPIEGGVKLETAPPVEDTTPPTLKWVSPMGLVRNYVQSFEPTQPYDEKTDQFIETPDASSFEQECGAVVHSKRSHTKQLGFLYNCVANFCNKLEGKVLVIGDNNGTIAYRTQFKFDYTFYRGDPDLNLLKDARRSDCLIFRDQHSTLFQKRKYDHIVVFLYTYDMEFPEDAQIHYLDLIPGQGGIMRSYSEGEYNISGKLVTLHPRPEGTSVPHTLLFDAFDPKDHFVIWHTLLYPTRRIASVIPLTNMVRLGPVEGCVISDKVDGHVCYLEVYDSILTIFNSVMQPQFSCEVRDAYSQILVLEAVDDYYIVAEPLYHEACDTFGQWLELKEYGFYYDSDDVDFPDLRFKKWYPYPLDYKWQEYAISNEGVIIKQKALPCGMKDHAFHKLMTYYVKLPNRVSYEDFIDRVVEESGVYLRGYHNIYSDPDNVYTGVGVYEVKLHSLALYRRRDKKFADATWYVEAVSQTLDYKKIFTLPLAFVRYYEIETQGLSKMINISSKIVADSQVFSLVGTKLIVKLSVDICTILVYQSKFYSVVSRYEGHSTALLMS